MLPSSSVSFPVIVAFSPLLMVFIGLNVITVGFLTNIVVSRVVGPYFLFPLYVIVMLFVPSFVILKVCVNIPFSSVFSVFGLPLIVIFIWVLASALLLLSITVPENVTMSPLVILSIESRFIFGDGGFTCTIVFVVDFVYWLFPSKVIVMLFCPIFVTV